jgi:predicted P-loop ATPase
VPQISIFKNWARVNNPENIDLIDHLMDIKEGQWEDSVTKARVLKAQGKEEEYKAFKDKMQTVSFSGLFEKRADAALIEHSKIIAMDLDIYDHPDLNGVKEKFKTDPHVFSVFLSTSGMGLRVLFRIDSKRHRDAFLGISKYIKDHYQIIVDANSSVSKPYIVSFDPDLYLNESAPVWTIYNKETVLKKEINFVHTRSDFQEVFKNIEQRNVLICEEYNDWYRLGFALAEEFGEEGRSYFHVLSRIDSKKYRYEDCDKQYTSCLKAGKTGVNISTFYYLAKSAGINISSEKTKTIIRATKNGKKAGLSAETIIKNLAEFENITDAQEVVDKIFGDDSIQAEKDAQDSPIEQLEMFLRHNYTIKFNEVTGYLEQHGKRLKEVPELFSIFIAAKKLIPKLDYSLMMKVLKSDFTPRYNPFFEYLGSDGIPVILPPYPVKNEGYDSPIISKLASCLKCDNPGYTEYFTRKWLVSIISAMHGVHSPLSHYLLGAQGKGKTHFYDYLLPEVFRKDYYIHSKLDKGKDSELEMCENILILDDELYGKSAKESILFNSISSMGVFSIRRPYGDANEKITRLAVQCGTSNYLDVIKDPTGNRRIIAIEVFDIDKDLYNSIDKGDLLKEAFMLYKQGFDWRILGDDIVFLNTDQAKYEMSNFERDLLEKYFSVPPEGTDEECRLSTSDIKIELEKFTRTNVNLSTLGKELKRAGYQLKTTRTKTGTPKLWLVNRESRTEFFTPPNSSPASPASPEVEDLPF